MYVPKHFEQHEPEALHGLIREHPLGVLVMHGADGLSANHLPFELDVESGRATLLAHVARANPLLREIQPGQSALVIFRGAEAYISPNWYPSKHESHRQVPTWNYQAVHVHGRITIRDDETFLRALLARLTHTHETRAGQQPPWTMNDSPREFIERMVAAVVGIELHVERMVGKWKLSQNKDARDRESAAQALEQRGELPSAAAIRATLPGAD